MDKVSAIIPTYNRLKFVLNSIKSIKAQTYQNIEIIVVNDCSIEKEYYEYDFGNDVKIIHLKESSRNLFGYPCTGYVRNEGIKNSTGKYVAFLDDDDIWLPNKIELQVNAMKKSNCKMCCTDGLIGNGVYNENIRYSKYNAEYYYTVLNQIYKESTLLNNGFPTIWNLDFIKIHNCCITSSVIVEKEILEKINYMKYVPKNGREDYDCWLRILEHTNCCYLKDVCFYYDNGHGNGQNW